MVTSSVRLIEQALYTLLTNDTGAGGVMTLVKSVVNDVRHAEAFPYIFISHAHEKPWHTMGGPAAGKGWIVLVRLHIYSQYEGDNEALLILDRLVTLLDFAPVAVTGYATVFCEYINGRVLVEQLEKIETRHIPAEFKVTVRE